jgi:hypothetical protein
LGIETGIGIGIDIGISIGIGIDIGIGISISIGIGGIRIVISLVKTVSFFAVNMNKFARFIHTGSLKSFHVQKHNL